ncbi:hypothetical protein B0A48_03428 [Cryoendolithus antarcticus]|uniref:Uncharacterized protein n=1 Tax=Cryoendolithus antarcticus TaxID=1507870 RepID=A0A1V8TKC1_9PEZI|nr:hypothetical protein B0A48_03428 [Cryoendolithus antarcticus]
MLTKYGKLEYPKCKIGELRRFLSDREAIDNRASSPGSRLDKSSMVKRLRELDKSASFHRFNDLPTKVRLIVYGYTLAHKAPDCAQTEILRVSKSVHAEAEEVLHISYPFTIRIWYGGSGIGTNMIPHCSFESIVLDHDDYGAKHALAAMHKVRNLKLRLQTPNGLYSGLCSHFHGTVRAICIIMADAPRLQDVAIEVIDPNADLLDARWVQILGTTSFLSKRARITMSTTAAEDDTRVVYFGRAQPVLPADDLVQVHNTATRAREFLPRLDGMLAGVGGEHATKITRAFRHLYFGVNAMRKVSLVEMMQNRVQVEKAVERAKRFKDAFDGAMKLRKPQ